MLEDDNSLRELAVELLSDLGYDVRAASLCRDAERLAIELHPDVLLVDMLLPDGRGDDAARRIVAAHPAVQVVYMSGNEATAPEGKVVLGKPFTLDALESAISQALGAPRGR